MRHYILTEIKGAYVPGGKDTAPLDINEDGVVTGADGDTDASDPMFRRMFVYSNASLADVVDVAAEGLAINASGDIAGQTFDFGPSMADKYLNRACVRKGGTLIDLHALMNPVPEHSCALDINDGGDVVGTIGNGEGRGWLYSKSNELVDLTSTVDPSIVSCVGINNSRVIVGMRSPGDQAFVYDLNTQTMSLLPLTRPVAINSQGDVVGMIGPVAAIYSAGQITPINGLGGVNADPADINGARHVVGTIFNGNEPGLYHGFFRDDGGTFDINDWIINKGGWVVNAPLGLNDSDQVVALATRADEHFTGVLLTPVDLPPKAPGGAVATIISGILDDAPGWELVNGHWRHVGPGPDDPWRRIWNGLTASQRDSLLGMGIQEIASIVHDSGARAELQRVGRQLAGATATSAVTSHQSEAAKKSESAANVAPLGARGRFGKFGIRRF